MKSIECWERKLQRSCSSRIYSSKFLLLLPVANADSLLFTKKSQLQLKAPTLTTTTLIPYRGKSRLF